MERDVRRKIKEVCYRREKQERERVKSVEER
jgi:hypothetical protein